MEIIIKNPKTKVVKKNEYVVVVHTMEGDADDYHKTKFSFYNTPDWITELKDLHLLLERCKLRYPHGKRGCNNYRSIPGFEKWFGEGGWFQYEGIVDSFKSYDISFFDSNEIEHKCEMKFSKQDKENIKTYYDSDEEEEEEYEKGEDEEEEEV